jgi:thymidine phosphorylase
VGDKVARGDILAQVFASDPARTAAAATALGRVITVSPAAPKPVDMVIARLNNKR